MKGTLDVAVTEPIHLAQDAAAGKPVLGFARFFHTDGGVMYLSSTGIKSPKDMCGKTIQYPGSPGPGGPAIVNTMVKADGGDCTNNSYGRHNNGFYHTDALRKGDADIATLIFYNFEMVEANHLGLDANFFSLKDWGVPDFCQLVLFTTPEKYKSSKPGLRKLVLAVRRATGFIHRNPSAAASHYTNYASRTGALPSRPSLLRRLNPFTMMRRSKEAKLERETMKATLPAFPNDNTLSEGYNDALMGWLVETGQVESSEGVESYWTNEIAL